MADIDLLPPRGIPYAALVNGNGVAVTGTQTVAQLASRGIRAFAAVDELGVSTDDAVTKADTIRMRGIRPMVAVDANGVSQTGSATIPVLAQRGLGYFCPLTRPATPPR